MNTLQTTAAAFIVSFTMGATLTQYTTATPAEDVATLAAAGIAATYTAAPATTAEQKTTADAAADIRTAAELADLL